MSDFVVGLRSPPQLLRETGEFLAWDGHHHLARLDPGADPVRNAAEAYSHEVSSAGFWPGGGAIDYPAFYSYAYPEPDGFRATPVRPAAAFFSNDLREFILPYDAVRTAAQPDQALLEFLQSTYEAAANCARWDRDALECSQGQPGVVRKVL